VRRFPSWLLVLVGVALGASAPAAEAALPPSSPGDAPAPSGQLTDEAGWIKEASALTQGVQLDQVRRALEGLIRDDLREPARIEPTAHQIRLVAAANAGSLSAAARLVDLGWWNGMQRVDCLRPVVAAWEGDGQAVGLLTAGQIFAQLALARRQGESRPGMPHAAALRAQWQNRVRQWPLRHPMLLAEDAYLAASIDPVQGERADQSVDTALAACASDPLFSTDDVLAIEGRGAALSQCAWCMDADARNAACAIFAGGAARSVEHGSIAAEGVSILYLGMLRMDMSSAGMEQWRTCLDEAETLFAEAGDIDRQGRCQGLLANLRRWGKFGIQVEERDVLSGSYRSAAELCRRSGDWRGYGRIIKDMASWLRIGQERMAGDWGQIAAAYGDAASAFQRADEVQERAECLYWQAVCASPDHIPGSDWRLIAGLHREAEACFAHIDGVDGAGHVQVAIDGDGLRLFNLCGLGEALGMLDDRTAALEQFTRAAGLARGFQGSRHRDLQRRLRNGMRDFAR